LNIPDSILMLTNWVGNKNIIMDEYRDGF